MEQEKKRQPEQEGDNAQDRKISSSLRENEKYLRKRLENCSDILIRPMRLGEQRKVDCLMVYIEVAVSNMMLDDSAIGKNDQSFLDCFPGTDPGVRSVQQSGNRRCKEVIRNGRGAKCHTYGKCSFLYGWL